MMTKTYEPKGALVIRNQRISTRGEDCTAKYIYNQRKFKHQLVRFDHNEINKIEKDTITITKAYFLPNFMTEPIDSIIISTGKILKQWNTTDYKISK